MLILETEWLKAQSVGGCGSLQAQELKLLRSGVWSSLGRRHGTTRQERLRGQEWNSKARESTELKRGHERPSGQREEPGRDSSQAGLGFRRFHTFPSFSPFPYWPYLSNDSFRLGSPILPDCCSQLAAVCRFWARSCHGVFRLENLRITSFGSEN